MHRPLCAVVLCASLLFAGCAEPSPAREAPVAEDPAPTTPAGAVGGPGFDGVWQLPVQHGFAPSVTLVETRGYEPSIRVRDDGMRFVTAHKATAAEGERLSSWLWSSPDGVTWSEVDYQGAPTGAPALEGDLALDAEGRLYFVDTYLADAWLYRFGTDNNLEWARTLSTLPKDDRPWLDAHGDGIVYYLGNDAEIGTGINPSDLTADRGWIWFSASTDGGVTWSPATTVEQSYWFCGLAASRADDQTVHRGCNRVEDGVVVVFVETSTDRGSTWVRTDLASREHRSSSLYYSSTATDVAGNAYHAWIDDDPDDALPGRIGLATGTPGQDGLAWNVTYFDMDAALDNVWLDAYRPGHVAISFYATPEHPVGDASTWGLYVLESRSDPAETPWALWRVDPETLATGASAPQDFQQVAMTPDAIHVAYQKDRPDVQGIQDFITADIRYAHLPTGTAA